MNNKDYYKHFEDVIRLNRGLEPFIVGSVLSTKDGRLVGNALILQIIEDEVIILTDFGNLVKLSKNELTKYFHEERKMRLLLKTLPTLKTNLVLVN